MFHERYNRIVLPFIFIIEFLFVSFLYVICNFILVKSLYINVYLFFPSLLWSIISFYYKSFRVPRVNSYRLALKPNFYTWLVFSFIYLFSTNINLIPTLSLSNEVIYILLIALFTISFSALRFAFFLRYRRKGRNYRNAILLGSFSSEEIKIFYNDAKHYGYHFINMLSEDEKFTKSLEKINNEQKIDIVFLRESGKSLTDNISAFCDEHGIRLKLLLLLSTGTALRARLDTIGGFPVMDIRHEPLLYLGNRTIKRILDIIIASFSILFVLTWLPFIVKIVQVFSFPGPLLFRQSRVGRDGNIFLLYKFRTMHITNENSNAEKGQSKKTKAEDSRVAWFGRILRKTNLDEYPQFINVLIGSMSTVGPRPHMVGEDKILEENVQHYRIRRFVKPGVTGWAAINGYRGGTDNMDLMRKRTEHDIWYLENWSVWLDIKIIVITILQMITFRIPKAY